MRRILFDVATGGTVMIQAPDDATVEEIYELLAAKGYSHPEYQIEFRGRKLTPSTEPFPRGSFSESFQLVRGLLPLDEVRREIEETKRSIAYAQDNRKNIDRDLEFSRQQIRKAEIEFRQLEAKLENQLAERYRLIQEGTDLKSQRTRLPEGEEYSDEGY